MSKLIGLEIHPRNHDKTCLEIVFKFSNNTKDRIVFWVGKGGTEKDKLARKLSILSSYLYLNAQEENGRMLEDGGR